MNIKYILLVGAGSFIGGVIRFLISFIIKQNISIFPISLFLATFIVNVVGCFFIGLLYGLAYKQILTMPGILFACVGIMGGFTTFSTFSFETLTLVINKQILYAIFYVVSSILVGFFFTYMGFLIAK